MKILTFSGSARHGKDTSAMIAGGYLDKIQKTHKTIHYADYLKYVAREYWGWNGEKDEAGRTLLQWLGTDIARERNPNIWVNVAVEFIKTFGIDYDYIFIPDTRFPNEIYTLKNKGWDVHSFWIHRNDFDNGLTEQQKNHPSETALLDYPFDRIISVESKIYKLKDELEKIINLIEGK